MKNIFNKFTVMSVALVLFCVSAMAQNEKNSMTNEVKNEITLTDDADDFNLGPDPCEVYKGEEVNVEVIFPVGYSDLIFSDYSKSLTGTYFTAEICEKNGKVVIKVKGRNDYPDTDVKHESLTVYAIKKNAEYNRRSILSAPQAVLGIIVKSKF